MREVIRRGELARSLYRIGRHQASGTLTLSAPTRREWFVVHRGALLATPGSPALSARLSRLVDEELMLELAPLTGESSPAGSLPLAHWARGHIEAQLDSSLADRLVREFAGVRIALRSSLAPEPLDETDRRMLAAMATPRRIDQIAAVARTPRFRLLALVHFLRTVDALELAGVAADAIDARRAALATLGISEASPEQVKRAYRRLARSVHPDLQPDADPTLRRDLERRFVELTSAYETLLTLS